MPNSTDQPSEQNFQINADDSQHILSFIKSHNSAVLTIMFTDIEGFTALTESAGDEYAAQLRQHHDDLMKDEIESDGAGLIIKFIGDAVMAIFSEPSTAVATAMYIQESIRTFNEDHASEPELKVRIGLHMGQVSIESDVQIDIFGRHVNRAARIEGLAKGGQVLVSYPVIDSAMGWLKGQNEWSWAEHGKYHLKGIEESIEVFEIYNEDYVTPHQPEKGRVSEGVLNSKKSILLAFSLSAVLALVLFFSVLYPRWQAPELYLEAPYPQALNILTEKGSEAVKFAGNQQDERRLLDMPLSKGDNLMYYAVADGVRYYAVLPLQAGQNQLKAKYKEWRLPSVRIRNEANKTDSQKRSRTADVLYWQDGKMVKHSFEINMDIVATVSESDSKHLLSWTLKKDGKQISQDTFEITKPNKHKIERNPAQILWQDELFKFELKSYSGNQAFEANLNAVFLN
jgi:class 3 adenylate cyclase